MLTLFLDTSSGITVGLLNKDLQWCYYNYIDSKKSSSVVHKLIKDALDDVGKSQSEINQFIQMSGPGSYTGMRVSDGISQILEWQQVQVYGIYHFQIPKVLNYSKGAWMAKAFKGEIFVHEWSTNDSEQYSESYMVKESNISNHLEKLSSQSFHLFSSQSFDIIASNTAIIETKKLIEENPEKIFTHVINSKMTEPLYYFRSLEEEFTKAKN